MAFATAQPLLFRNHARSRCRLRAASSRCGFRTSNGLFKMTVAKPQPSGAVVQAPFQWPSDAHDNAESTGSFTWENNWYPVAWVEDVPDDRPVPVTIFSRSYVLFRDPVTSTYVVMDDVCPHRAAPLSEGRLFQRDVDGKKETILECGYHGWRFNCEGTCVDIPVIELSRKIPSAADVGGVYVTTEVLGLVFMWLGDRAKADEALIPIPKQLMEMDRNHLAVYRNIKREFPISYSHVVENLVDPAHVNWSHHGTGQGDRTRVRRDVVLSSIDSRPENGFFLTGINLVGMKEYRTKLWFQAPCFVGYDSVISYEKGSGRSLLTWVVPTDHGKCTLFAGQFARNSPRAKFMSMIKPRWYEHTIANLILDGDVGLLQFQEKHLQDSERDGHGGSWKSEYSLASGEWDRLVALFRGWLDSHAASMPFVSEPPKTPLEKVCKEDLLDRYQWHTKDCGCCAPALRNFRRGRAAAVVIGIVGVLTSVCASLLLAVLGTAELVVETRPLIYAGLGGMVACGLMILVGIFCTKFIRLMTHSTIAYDLNHLPSE